MNIFITGATGAIGKALVLKLLENHDLHIFALVRGTSDVSFFPKNKNLQIIRCDFLNKNELAGIFQNTKIDFFVHLAARVSSWGKKDDFINDNVLVTENILEALSDKLNPESVFIYASTIAVYGFENNYCREDTRLEPFGWNYADSKISAEQEIVSFFKKTNAKSLILRIGDIASDETNWVSGIQKESKVGFFLCPKVSGTMYFLCIDDIVQLFLKIFNSKHIEPGVYNVVGEKNVPFSYFFEQLTQQLGIKAIKCSKWFMFLASYFNVIISKFFRIKTEFTPEVMRYILSERKISAEKTIKEFNWKPDSLCYNKYVRGPAIFN